MLAFGPRSESSRAKTWSKANGGMYGTVKCHETTKLWKRRWRVNHARRWHSNETRSLRVSVNQ